MTRIGEDVSEKLDVAPAEFFEHRHICGRWACRCCERLVQGSAAPEIIDGGIPAGPRRGPYGSKAGRAHADQPLRRPPAVLPARNHQRPLGCAHGALDLGGVGGPGRRGPPIGNACKSKEACEIEMYMKAP